MEFKLELKNLSILFVEDDAILRDEFSEILSRLYGNITSARNGKHGLYLYDELIDKKTPPNIIISDIDMPIMNGIEFLEKIREKNKKVPFIFTTAHSDVDFLLKSISLNVSEYLIKPVNINALKSKIEILYTDMVKKIKETSNNDELLQYIDVVNQVAIVSRTDKKGIITYVNDLFCEVSGYSYDELIGSNHNIVRHPENAALFFKNMWIDLTKGKSWKGKIKNLTKSGEDYYLVPTIIPLYENKKIYEYVSISFLTTDQEVKHREFKKKVMSNYQETRKTNLSATQKIEELEKKSKHLEIMKDAFEKEKKEKNKLLIKVSSIEKELESSDDKIKNIIGLAKEKVLKAVLLVKDEKENNKETNSKFNSMQANIYEKEAEIKALNLDINKTNKRILELKDVINHREDELYDLKEKNK